MAWNAKSDKSSYPDGMCTRGKKRARPESEGMHARAGSSSLSPPPEEQLKPKRSKRAETRTCPVCNEKIPVRLLGVHADLEMNRVEEILRGVGPLAVAVDPEAGPSTSRRGAALKARRTINPRGDPDMNTVEQIEKTLRLLQRNRKSRNAKLKEIISLDDDGRPSMITGNAMTCPVCLTVVRGDEDVIDAHVNSCIANASRLQAEVEERERREREGLQDPWGEIEVDGEIRIHLDNVNGLRGTGVHIRDRTQLDAEEEVDVDGDDDFGMAQFTEQDVMDPSFAPATGDGEDDDDGGKTLRDLVAEGKVLSRSGVRAEVEQLMSVGDTDRMNKAIVAAHKSGDTTNLIAALESKLRQLEAVRTSSSTSLLCRICLDPYNEPTVSTGCWHTCCRACWLRCLGSTKLCPICKRITAATDLRRIYL